jgi:hypothetical protein
MVKKLFGLLFGATLVATFAGPLLTVSTGCSSDSNNGPGPQDSSVAEVKPKIDRNEEEGLACLQPPAQLIYRSPFVGAGKCTPTQITDFLNCFGTGDENKCKAFLDADANSGCLDGCLLTQRNGTNFGALVGIYINYVGYYEMNGVSKACLDAQWTQFSCESTSCESCETDTDTDACLNAIYNEGGQCRDFALAAETACRAEATKVSTLDGDLKNIAGVNKILTAFCGGPADGGTDASSDASDAADSDIADADDSG